LTKAVAVNKPTVLRYRAPVIFTCTVATLLRCGGIFKLTIAVLEIHCQMC